jgi:hypothetical protein
MNRIHAVQTLLDASSAPNYLEIGVERGWCFSGIRAKRKIAVDPELKLSPRRRRRSELGATHTHFFEQPSDDFFAQQHELLAANPIDVALIDGLHTFEQTLRDIENVLKHLRRNGTIVVHDCNPKQASVGYPAANYAEFRRAYPWRLAWSGDVWKAVALLRATRADLKVAVLDCDWGVGLIRFGEPDSKLEYAREQIAGMTYDNLAGDRARLLNLRRPEYFREFLVS